MQNKFLSSIGLDGSNVEIIDSKLNENGYLVINCIFARTGIQIRYGVEIDPALEPYKPYKEYRSPSEVFKPSVIDGFRNVVITNEHPKELLNSDNTSLHAIGFVSSNVEVVEEKYLKTEITIFDKQTIEEIQAGKVELSAGYLYSLEFVEDQDFDYLQKNIKPNHIAIVEAGRCGSSCSLAFDSNFKKGNKTNMKVTFYKHLPSGEKEVAFEIEISNEEEAKKLQEFADGFYAKSKEMVEASTAKDEEIQEAKNEALDLKKANDSLQAQLDTKSKQVPAKDCSIVQALALDLASVIAVANDAGIDTKEFKTALDYKAGVITHYNPTMALDDKSEEYVNSAYDVTLDLIKGADSSFLKGLNLDPKKADDTNKKDENEEAVKGFDSKFGGKN